MTAQTTRRTSKITAAFVAVNLDYISSTASIIPCTARTAMTITGTNGASVSLKAGEKFFLYRASSLGPNMFYIVRDVFGMKKCSCPSRKPCKHEIAMQSYVAAKRNAGKAMPMAEAKVAAKANRTDEVRGTLNGNGSFLDALFGSSPEMSKYRSDYAAQRS